MHVRVRQFGKPDVIVAVQSKLTKIEIFREILEEKFGVKPSLQRLVYGGKQLENGYTLYDYNVKLNDVILLTVRTQPDSLTETSTKPEDAEKKGHNEIEYKDAESKLYAIGDIVDFRDRVQGVWCEGKIIRIVCDPSVAPSDDIQAEQEKENDSALEQKVFNDNKMKNIKGKGPKGLKNAADQNKNPGCQNDVIVFYKVQPVQDEYDSDIYYKVEEIRPRARTVVDVNDLQIGQKVMVNYNPENSNEKGNWYDFKVSRIVKQRKNSVSLVGTMYFGCDSVPRDDVCVQLHDKVFAIEEVIPLEERTEEYTERMKTSPEKRSSPLACLTCRDVEDVACQDCGCSVCCSKESPDKIILCDECNNGYHMSCLVPPLLQLPDDDWYCPGCKRDPGAVIAPGAAKQVKKLTADTKRDWGRGMACVGKTKTCSMPPNHFGAIPGVEVGMCWRFRIQLSESGVHRPPVSGIHGREEEGAYSLVLSGGYEDDEDNGYEFTYTGSGGRDLSGNKRTAVQSCHQTLTRENKALARNCAVAGFSEKGKDAGDKWREGRPVRVVRSCKMRKHFPKYAPKEGNRYDGLYKVVKYYPETGLSGFIVWKYLLRRDDPEPAPWEPNAKQFNVIYPDGYLEAEAEKKARKASKAKGGQQGDVYEPSSSTLAAKDKSPAKRPMKASCSRAEMLQSPETKSPTLFKKRKIETALSEADRRLIEADSLNARLWTECMDVIAERGKKAFIDHVNQAFFCIICQEIAANPVTTPCFHNFCMPCMQQTMKYAPEARCPWCRSDLTGYVPQPNAQLQAALRALLTGYDAGKK